MTTTAAETLKKVLTEADPNRISDALRLVDLGNEETPIDETITLSAVNATVKTSQPVKSFVACRVTDVTGGTAARVGHFVPGDKDATPAPPAATTGAPGIAALGADMQSFTFDGTVKAARFVYYPASKTPLSTVFDNA